MQFDLVVIGGGAAGLAAARAGRRKGATVGLVSAGPLGGDCTFYGCVPSKTLIEAARQGVEFDEAIRRVHDTVARIAASENAGVLRGEGIEVIEASACLAGPGLVQTAGPGLVQTAGPDLRYRRLVIATGTTPVVPDLPGIADARPLTNETVFDVDTQPASLLIIGGGPIGVELGQAFARLGTSVTLIEAAERILAREEPEAAAVIAGALAADGVDIRTSVRVSTVTGAPGRITAQLDDGTSVHAEQVLVAVGRSPRTEALQLARAGVRVDERGYIVTDSHLRTTASAIYAAGDITGRALFTHAADEMGRTAAYNALSRLPWRRFHQGAIPEVTYTSPELASVGLTEHQAAETVPGARVAELPLAEVDRAVTAGRTDGYIKLIVGPRRGTASLAGGRLIGATVVAPHAGEMIAVPTLALRTGMFPARLALTVQAYPTWTLGVRQAAAQFFGESGGRRARPARPQPGGGAAHQTSHGPGSGRLRE